MKFVRMFLRVKEMIFSDVLFRFFLLGLWVSVIFMRLKLCSWVCNCLSSCR